MSAREQMTYSTLAYASQMAGESQENRGEIEQVLVMTAQTGKKIILASI